MLSYLAHLLVRSRRLFIVLVRIMLPVMIVVRVGEELGWIDALGQAMAPAMAWIALPPEAGMIWIASVFVGVYGAIAALIGLAHGLEMSAGQFSALSAMILFAHALPVEQAIVRRAGASPWVTGALRIGVALAYGGAVAWGSRLTGVLAEPIAFDWLSGSDFAADPADAGLWAWVRTTAVSLVVTFAIIAVLLVLLDALERSGITRRITTVLTPLLRISGLEASAAPVTTVGVLLGLTYGGALIIEEAERQAFPARTRFLALSWLCLSHGLIEDTALLAALGADLWVVLAGRLALTLAVVAVLARLPGLADPALAAARSARRRSS